VIFIFNHCSSSWTLIFLKTPILLRRTLWVFSLEKSSDNSASVSKLSSSSSPRAYFSTSFTSPTYVFFNLSTKCWTPLYLKIHLVLRFPFVIVGGVFCSFTQCTKGVVVRCWYRFWRKGPIFTVVVCSGAINMKWVCTYYNTTLYMCVWPNAIVVTTLKSIPTTDLHTFRTLGKQTKNFTNNDKGEMKNQMGSQRKWFQHFVERLKKTRVEEVSNTER